MRGGTGKTCSMRLSLNGSLSPNLSFSFFFIGFCFNSVYPSSSNSFYSKTMKFNSDLKIDLVSKPLHFLMTLLSSPNPKQLSEMDRSNPFLGHRLAGHYPYSYSYRSSVKLFSDSTQLHMYSVLQKNHQPLWERTEVLQADPKRLQKLSCSDTSGDIWELNNWSSGSH